MARPFVDSLIGVLGGTAFLPPVVWLDGRRRDHAVCTSAACVDGFGLEASAVPDTGTWPLMAVGQGGQAAARRHRAGSQISRIMTF